MTEAQHYVKWKRVGSEWHGYSKDGRWIYCIWRKPKRTCVYLSRVRLGEISATETCSTTTVAKSYANNLARLSRFEPL